MLKPFRALGYAFERAAGSLRRKSLANLLVVLAIAASFVVVGAVHLVERNVDSMTRAWSGGAHMVVYLDDTASPERAEAISDALLSLPAVDRVTYVPATEALDRLRSSLGDHDDLVAGLESGMLPASLEVTLAPGVVDVVSATPVVERLEATAGVDEIELIGAWVDRVGGLLSSLRYAAWFVFAFGGALSIILIGSTLQLRLGAERAEDDVMALVGASDRFVKGPVLLEGIAIGTAGAALAALALWAVFERASGNIAAAVSASFGDVTIAFLPAAHIGMLIGAGAAMGLIGSWIATRRTTYA